MMKYRTVKTARRAVAAVALFAAATSFAGVKYWDNPGFRAYDVGDYVQDGLVLHYDGIRNVGAGEGHSDSSDTWVNLASDGAYPMGWYSWILNSDDGKYYRENGNTSYGAWADNGFAFNGLEGFAATNITFGIGPTYTLQLTMTASTADLTDENGTTGYIFRPGKGWEYNAVAIRQTANGSTTPANAIYVIDRTRFGSSSTRANFQNANPRYATVLADSDAIRIFETTKIPTASTGGNSYKAQSRTATDNNEWFAFGSQYDGSPRSPRSNLQSFNGTLHAIRYYSKTLTEEQLAWNRVIDEYRFFGALTQIPATNVVVATSAAGTEGDQPCGAYAVDAEGYTFTAPPQCTVNGKRYVLNGYTLETWNGTAWGAPVAHEGASYDATSSEMVRLTWQYVRPEGEGQIKVYDVGDYVQEGLLLHYDGIRNVNANAAHDSEARHWSNIAPGYESRWPMDWCSYLKNGDSYSYKRNNYTEGEWTDDGFAFTGRGYFAKWNDGDPFAVTTNFTMQFSVTGTIADQPSDVSYLWSTSVNWYNGSVALRRTNGSSEALGQNNCAYYVNDPLFADDQRPNFYPVDAKPSYITVIADYDDTKTAYAFEGTSRPGAGGHDAPAIDGGKSPATNLTWYSVGGFHNRTGVESALQCFRGTLHNVRFYNRALTDAEVAQNRKVDEFRFHGRYTDPNVLVHSSHSYLSGYDKCGAYEVDGSYTFAAPATAIAVNGIEYACDGYTIETWNGADWSAAVFHESRSYAYTTAAGIVRITWKWRATRGLRTAADYTVEDYVSGGLVLHYDGICNVGAREGHSDSTGTWANLASGGDYPLTWMSWVYQESAGNYKRITGDQTCGAWTDNGFAFDGRESFHTKDAAFSLPPSYTMQFVTTATAVDQSETGNTAYLFRPYENWTWGAICFRTTENSGVTPANAIYTVDGGRYGTDRTRPNFSNASPRYATVVGTPTALSCFEGTAVPTSGDSIKQGDKRKTGYASTPFAFGGVYDAAATRTKAQLQSFVGTIHAIRYYDRPLTDAELERNRNVDSARYFGELAVTNVYVVAGGEGAEQKETGAYKVEGEWTFTATTATNKVGAVVDVAGYYTEDIVNGKVWHEGTNYTYQVGRDAPTVRLTWSGPRPGMIFILR